MGPLLKFNLLYRTIRLICCCPCRIFIHSLLRLNYMKNILVVGASSGIGKALAELLQGEGHNVMGTYRSNEVSGSQYHYLDVLEDDISLDFLPESLDGLVYCPGSINLKPFARLKPAAFEEDYKLQVVGAVKVLQAALKAFKKSESAAVVLFSTVAVQA